MVQGQNVKRSPYTNEPTVEVPRETADYLRFLSQLRTRSSRKSKKTKKLKEDYDYIGLIGEYGFAKRTGLPMTVRFTGRGDPGYDFISKGWTVDVKSTLAKYPRLYVPTGPLGADYYVLVQVSLEPFVTYKFLGMSTSFEVYHAERIGPPELSCDNQVVPLHNMHDTHDLPRLFGFNRPDDVRDEVSIIIEAPQTFLDGRAYSKVKNITVREELKRLKPKHIKLLRRKNA